MREWVWAACVVASAGIAPSLANAQTTYHPDFNCAKVDPNDSIALMLCQNSDAAKHELIFDQTYYALRQVVGRAGWKALKQEAIADDDALRACVSQLQPADGPQPPPADPSCYVEKEDAITAKYRPRLTGAALEEATRPIDAHIALQQRLVDLGYLPAGTAADGVYGESTRQAIQTWERVSHQPEIDGFISDQGAKTLQQALAGPNTPEPDDTGTPSTAPEPTTSGPGWEHSPPCSGVISNNFQDPYADIGRCGVMTLSVMGTVQWLGPNAALFINTYIPGMPPFAVSGDEHLRLNTQAYVIQVTPLQYESTSGAQSTVRQFKVLHY